MRVTPAQRRAAVTFLDQSVSSVSNFATGVVIARVAGAAALGDYMLTMMLWLIAVGVHRALITEPIIVASPGDDDRASVVADGLAAEVLLGSALAAVVGLGGLTVMATGAPIGSLILALSVCLVPLLVQDYWRAMAYQQRLPAVALGNDLVFVIAQVLATAVVLIAGWKSASAIIIAWGVGAAAGAVVGCRHLPAMGGWRGGLRLLRRLSTSSRWMLADFATAFASHQSYLGFVALLLPRVEYGGFRAAFSLMGPIFVIMLAGGNIGLPEASRRNRAGDRDSLRRFTRQLTAGTASCVAAYGIVLTLVGKDLLKVLYGPSFARFGPLVSLGALQFLIVVLAFGPGIALKAAGRMRHLWRARVLVAITALAATTGLVHVLGTTGAGWAGVSNASMFACAVFVIYRSEIGRPTTDDSVAPAVR